MSNQILHDPIFLHVTLAVYDISSLTFFVAKILFTIFAKFWLTKGQVV
jgi:hypothetical protein